MAKDKKAFVLYADQKEIFTELPDDYAGKLIKHIFRYITDEDPKTDDLLLKISFASIKAQLKRDLKKYEAKSAIRSESGRLGGLASGEARRSKAEQDEANEPNGLNSKQNEQDIDTVIDKDIDNKRIPAFEEFLEYAILNKPDVDKTNLELKYKAWVEAGWKDGNGKAIKNWKSKLLNTLPHIKQNEKSTGSLKNVDGYWPGR